MRRFDGVTIRIQMSVIILLLMSSCNQQSTKPSQAKGELAFLLQYNNRLPSDVGFLTNHIMERRVANLLKEKYEPFIQSIGEEHPLRVDSVKQVVFAFYGDNQVHQSITVDVANDAIWVSYGKLAKDSVSVADRTSLEKPL